MAELISPGWIHSESTLQPPEDPSAAGKGVAPGALGLCTGTVRRAGLSGDRLEQLRREDDLLEVGQKCWPKGNLASAPSPPAPAPLTFESSLREFSSAWRPQFPLPETPLNCECERKRRKGCLGSVCMCVCVRAHAHVNAHTSLSFWPPLIYTFLP